MLSTYFGNFDYWQLYHKVTFDPALKLITVNPNETAIDVQVDLYSASKEWLKVNNNLRYRPPMRAVGGDLIPGGSPLGRTFFLTNGWRILIDHGVEFDGNLYSDNFPSPFVNAPGVQIVRSKFSNLVDVAEPDISNIGSAVWEYPQGGEVAGTMGKRLKDIKTYATVVMSRG